VPARFRRVRSAGEHFGVQFAPPTGGGSHWKATKPGFRSYTIPAHNGERTEIGDHYIRGFCRHFAIDLDEFRSKL